MNTKVVFLTKGYPFPPRNGGAMRDAGIFRQLEKHFRAELLTVLPPNEKRPHSDGNALFVQREPSPLYRRILNPLFPYVANGYSRNVENALKERFEPGAVLWVSRISLGRYIRAAKKIGYRVVIDEHNVESDYYLEAVKSTGAWLELPLAVQLRWWEKKFCNEADHITATSSRDAEILSALTKSKSPIVIPNCVDRVYGDEKSKADGGLLFTGTLDYAPNIEGLEWLLTRVWPSIRNSRLQIVGARPSDSLKAKCKAAGADIFSNVPDLNPYYQDASICLAPIFSGGGTRLKILEALAHGKAVVATSKAAEGLALVNGRELLIADTAEEFIRAIDSLSADPGRAAELGRLGRSKVKENYLWEAQLPKIMNVIDCAAKIVV